MVDCFEAWTPADQTYPPNLSPLPDLFDGRLYHALIYIGAAVSDSERSWPEEILREGQHLWCMSGMRSASKHDFGAAVHWPRLGGASICDGVEQMLAPAEQLSRRSKEHANRTPVLQSSNTEDPFMPATLREVQARIASVTQPEASMRPVLEATLVSSEPGSVPAHTAQADSSVKEPVHAGHCSESASASSSDDGATWEDMCEQDSDEGQRQPEDRGTSGEKPAARSSAREEHHSDDDDVAGRLGCDAERLGADTPACLPSKSVSEKSSLRKFTADHHFHSTKPLCKDPDHLQFAQQEDKPRTFKFKSAFHEQKWLQKRAQRQATAAVRYTQSLLSGQPVTPQTIAEKLSPQDLAARRDAANKSLGGSVIHSQNTSDHSSTSPAASLSPRSQGCAASVSAQLEAGAKGRQKKQGSLKVSGTASKLKRQNAERMQQDALSVWGSRLLAFKDQRPAPKAKAYASDAESYLQRLREHERELAKAKAMKKLSDSTHGQLVFALGMEILDMLQTLPSNAYRRKQTFLTIQNILRTPHDCLRAVLADSDKTLGNQRERERQHVLVSAGLSEGFVELAAKVAALFGLQLPELPRQSAPVCSVAFQLEAAPEHLGRPAGVDDDPRVQFKPDAWQVRLLDIVDSGNSALVVAPTASGKTFISYYIMELCLRTDDQGVVVFVAPTKALVYQVWAELGARFSKQYAGKGKLSGVFTREHRENVYDCQILVTVPQCLSILLLASDKEHQQWATRLKHVIFDEVHMLGSGNGEVWEQLILLVPVPFVALSATLGDVHSFHAWMRRVERSKHRDVFLVEHADRHNDLLPWVYDPTLRSMCTLHPFAVLRDLVDRGPVRACPEDLRLLPEHCSQVFGAMRELLPAERAAALAPESFFRARRADAEWNVSTQDVRAWEREIKAEFCGLPRNVQRTVILQVSSVALSAFARVDEWLGSGDDERDMFEEHLPCLVEDLQLRGLLPALCFHFSRMGCMFFAEGLAAHLEERERKARESEGWQKQVESKEEEIRLLRLKASTRRTGTTKEEVMQEQMENDDKLRALKGELDRLRGIDMRFMLVPSGGSPIQESEILDALQLDKDMVIEMFPELEWLYKAMLRGVGVHHSGMPKKWRSAIEHLVRLKRLAIIFATGTLAMGINFPVKTSVLLGDAVYLNSMLYRQVIGRAGRRGMDLRGHTVFFGLPSDKVSRLIRSRLPSLLGNVVLSPSLVLRLLMRQSLLRDAVEAAPAKRKEELQRHQREAAGACARMVELPLFAPSALLREQASHNFHVCIQFLHAQGLLMRDDGGLLAPNDLSALIAHLFFMEPANFAFLALLQSGYLARLCRAQPHDARGAREERVVTLLSQLFGRRPVPSRVAGWLRKHERVGPSLVVLAELAEEPRSILQQHSARALETLQDFWHNFAVAFEPELGQDNNLPLTKRVQGACSPYSVEVGDSQSEGVRRLAEITLKSRVRSLFVAMSGHDDLFYSVADVCSSTRAGLHIDRKLVPVFAPPDSEAPMNSYLLDFYKHGQQKALTKYNGIKPDSVWPLLVEFDLCIKALLAAMERRALIAREWDAIATRDVIETFTSVSQRFHSQLKAIAV